MKKRLFTAGLLFALTACSEVKPYEQKTFVSPNHDYDIESIVSKSRTIQLGA